MTTKTFFQPKHMLLKCSCSSRILTRTRLTAVIWLISSLLFSAPVPVCPIVCTSPLFTFLLSSQFIPQPPLSPSKDWVHGSRLPPASWTNNGAADLPRNKVPSWTHSIIFDFHLCVGINWCYEWLLAGGGGHLISTVGNSAICSRTIVMLASWWVVAN